MIIEQVLPNASPLAVYEVPARSGCPLADNVAARPLSGGLSDAVADKLGPDDNG